MKPMQWIIALIVLVAMVFFITIAMNFLGEGTTGETKKPPSTDGDRPAEGPAILTFPTTIFYGDSGPGSFYEQEKHPGYHDFLFGNLTDEEVTITLKGVNCGQCTSVDVLLAPNELKTQLEPSFFQALLPAVVWALQDKLTRDATDKLQPVMQFENTKERNKQEVKVPPQARGWIRLKWNGEKIQPERYWGDLWSKNKTRTAVTRVEADVRIWAEPFKFEETEIALNEMQLEDLQNRQKPKTAVFKLWSPTRTQLHPKMTLLARWKPGEAPIILGEPEPMNPAEIAQLEEALQNSKTPARVTCAYRLPVTLLDRSPNGKEPFPFGPFRTRIRVSFDDEGIDPAVIMINGKLLGDVRTGGGDEGRFRFGTFDADKGSQALSVTLYSDVPGLQLEIDQERTPEFLRKNAKIEGPKRDGSESVWVVTTKVSKNTVTGQFPREDNEYFDCAVYVKTKGDASRSLRIPADGIANTR
jgi:hypothetical protein